MIPRILRHLHRMGNARRLKIPFFRRASFQMPAAIQLGSRRVELAYPDELGVRMDYLLCLVDDEYGLQQIRFPVATIADIGSNVGFFSVAARARFPDAIIHAYEPNGRVLPFLQTNAANAKFQVHPEAVGATEGIVQVEDSGDSNQARTLAAKDATSGVRQVALTTVIERLGGRVDLAKIDCEGAEWEMFQDTDAWKRIGNVRMEYHLWGRRPFTDLQDSLGRLGFEIYYRNSSGEWGTVWARNRAA